MYGHFELISLNYYLQNATTPNPTMECIEYALGAASDCIRCVCDIIDVIDGGDGTLCN